MEPKSILVSTLLLVAATAAAPQRGDVDPFIEIPKVGSKACGGKPADVVFLLDESSSIWIEHFTVNLKKFIKDIIHIFEISPTLTRIGALTFGNYPRLAFRLNDFTTEEEVIKAVDDIDQRGGNTDTAGALKYMREKMFETQYGGRKNEIQIGIVITDGESDNPTATALQARLAREQGIHLFAIGVGNAQEAELKNIASQPSDKFVFRVTNYGHLDTIKEMMALRTCKVTDAPTVKPTTSTPKPTTPKPTTTAPTTVATNDLMVGDRACGYRAPADVVFIIPETATLRDSNSAIEFIYEVTKDFDISDEGVRVGLVPKLCQSIDGIALDDYTENTKLYQKLLKSVNVGPNTARQLHYLRTRSFSQCEGARAKSKKIAIVLIDDKSSDVKETIEEATKLKKAGVEMFVVSIGKETDPKELAEIASPLTDQHLYSISTYKELHAVVDRVKRSINNACADFFF